MLPDDSAASPMRLVPLRPLAITEIVDGAVRIVWAHRRTLLAVTAPFAVLIAVGRSLTAYLTLGDGSLGFSLPAQLASIGLQLVFGAFVTALVARTVSASVVGVTQPPVRGVLPLLLPLTLLALLVAVGELVGLVLLVAGGVLLWGFWAVAAPALVLEGLGPVAALRRSVRLVRGSFGRVFGTRTLGWFLTSVIATLAVVPFEVAASFAAGGDDVGGRGVDQPVVFVAVLAVGQVAAALLVTPISSAIDVLIYTDQRMRREGLDIAVRLQRRPVAPVAPVTAW